jgi:hypothetical protein
MNTELCLQGIPFKAKLILPNGLLMEADRPSVCREGTGILWNPKTHYSVQERERERERDRQTISLCIVMFCSFEINLMLYSVVHLTIPTSHSFQTSFRSLACTNKLNCDYIRGKLNTLQSRKYCFLLCCLKA